MFTFKPKKVFDKLNKMDRKQAYTIGAIAVVSMVALLMLISAATTPKDQSFDGMSARGYDLANMPFATDAAEQFLLANAYPDMRENGSTLLYSAGEKEARQEEDAQAAEEASLQGDDNTDIYDDNTSAARSDNGGYGGYSGSGSGRSRGGGRGKTEVGQLTATGMAHSGGSGVSSTWGPTGDFRQFKGREDRGNEAPVQLKTGNARQALAQFRQGSRATASFKGNRMTGVRKALMGGNVAGSDAITKDGVDLSKVGGLELDTSAPPTSTDLDNLDDKVAEAAKKAEEKKKEEEKLGFWEQLGQDLLRQAASTLVDSVMGGIGDTIRGTINGSRASSAARTQRGNELGSTKFANLSEADKAYLTQKFGNDAGKMWDSMQGSKANRKYARNLPSASQAGADAWAEARAKASENYSAEQQAKARNNVTTQPSTTTATRK